MTDRQAELLATEFPPEVCGTLPKAGRKLTYVPVAEVIARLNQVLGVGNWSYHAERYYRDEIDRNWIICEVEIQALVDGETCIRAGVGGYSTKMYTEENKGMDIADAYKSALSEALKKAAQSLGVGLHLSRSEEAMAIAAMLGEEPEPDPKVELYESIKQLDDVKKEMVKDRLQEIGGTTFAVITPDQVSDLTEFVGVLVTEG